MFIREKKTDCANYREVDIIPRTEAAEQAARGKRGKKRKVNAPKQKDLNDKNAKRYLVQLGNGNFHIGDLHTSCTYSEAKPCLYKGDKEAMSHCSRTLSLSTI